ncbi:MAG: NAD(+) synthase [Clostridia bacterium]|nr:NAD(+) synthase [Clostridia bacterium]
MNVKQEKERIIAWLQAHKEQTNCKGVVLGLSGGKDSTTVAMLLKEVWGENFLAVLMPNGKQKDIDDSFAIAQTLGLNYRVVNIANAYEGLLSAIESKDGGNIDISDKSKTNVQPRLRMTTLYAIAQTLGYQVVGTGNASERFIGWFTKWGDGACDFNPIAHLTCTEVVELGSYLAREAGLDEKFVVKAPSDGLTGKTDEDNFGFTYGELDGYIRGNAKALNGENAEKIKKLHEWTRHKLQMPKVIE